MRLWPFRIWVWRERAGVCSDGPCWLCTYGYWMHCTGTLPELVVDVWSFGRVTTTSAANP
jgi:hypothetical protein